MEHILRGPPLVIFLATLTGHRDAWIAQLAALVDTHAPLDAPFNFIGQVFVGAMHIGEFRIAAVLR